MGKLNKLKSKRQQIESQNVDIIVPKVSNQVVSKIDYTKYELNDNVIEELKEKEYILVHSLEEIKKNFAEQSKTFYEAQQIFTSSSNEQNFNEWFLELGFKKTYVYQAINIYKLYLNYNIERIFDLPKEITYQLSKKQDDFNKEEIIEILENEKPSEKLKEINKIKEEGKQPKYEVDLSNFKVMELKEKKKELKNIKLSRKLKIEELARKKDDLKELKEEIEKLKEEIKNIKTVEDEMKLELLKA